MKIAYFTDTFFPQVNGVATVVENSATELGRQGHQVLIITPSPKKQPDKAWQARNVEVVHVPSVPAFVYPDFRMSPIIGLAKAFQTIHTFNPDVIHFHTTLSLSLDALLAAKFFKKPLIGTNHLYLTGQNTESIAFISEKPQLRKVISRVILSYSLAFYAACDVRIAPSKLLIDELNRNGYNHPIIYLPNGVEIPESTAISPNKIKQLKQQYGLAGRTILHVGRLSLEKHVDDLLQAFAFVCRRLDNVSLLIIGDGPERKLLETLAHKLGIADHTIFTGFIPHAELMSSGLIAAGDVFATASPMESQGMVIVEAMSFGLPVVAVNEAAVPEVVDKYGILVPNHDPQSMADRLEEVLNQPELAKKLQSLSHERAQEFSLSRLTKQLVDIYAEAIATKNGTISSTS